MRHAEHRLTSCRSSSVNCTAFECERRQPRTCLQAVDGRGVGGILQCAAQRAQIVGGLVPGAVLQRRLLQAGRQQVRQGMAGSAQNTNPRSHLLLAEIPAHNLLCTPPSADALATQHSPPPPWPPSKSRPAPPRGRPPPRWTGSPRRWPPGPRAAHGTAQQYVSMCVGMCERGWVVGCSSKTSTSRPHPSSTPPVPCSSSGRLLPCRPCRPCPSLPAGAPPPRSP